MRGRASRTGFGRDGFHRPGRLHRCHAGFSLLEVLVAFVVLALVGTALFRLFGGAMGNAGAADEWSRATVVAEAKLAQAAASEPLREATDAGTEDDGRLRWESKIAPYVPPDITPEAQQASEIFPLRLYRVSVVVRLPSASGRERAVTLETVKVAGREAK